MIDRRMTINQKMVSNNSTRAKQEHEAMEKSMLPSPTPFDEMNSSYLFNPSPNGATPAQPDNDSNNNNNNLNDGSLQQQEDTTTATTKRTRYDQRQLAILHENFESRLPGAYIDDYDATIVSIDTGLTHGQVKKWFSNKRSKDGHAVMKKDHQL